MSVTNSVDQDMDQSDCPLSDSQMKETSHTSDTSVDCKATHPMSECKDINDEEKQLLLKQMSVITSNQFVFNKKWWNSWNNEYKQCIHSTLPSTLESKCCSSHSSSHSLSSNKPEMGSVVKNRSTTSSQSVYSVNGFDNCELKTIPLSYFDPLVIDSNESSCDGNQSNDILFLKQEIDESKHELIKTLNETEERFADYLQEKEIRFLMALKSTEERIDGKLNAIVNDLKAIKVSIEDIGIEAKHCYSEFEDKFEMLNNENETNHKSFQDCIRTLIEIDSKLTDIQFNQIQQPLKATKQYSKLSTSLEVREICESINKRLAQELQSLIQNSFDNFKKTIIDEKIMEINGDRRISFTIGKKESRNVHSNGERDSNSYHLKATKDRETIKSEALDMLNSGNIRGCFANALNLGEPEFVSYLCTVFESSPQKLVSELEKCHDSQTIFISLLDQLFRDGVINKRWKITLIEMLMVRIDMQNEVTRRSVSQLAKHWSAVMSEIAQIGGHFSQEAKLLSISFAFLTDSFQ